MSPGRELSIQDFTPSSPKIFPPENLPCPENFLLGKSWALRCCPFWIPVCLPTLHISPKQIRTVKVKAIASFLGGCNCVYVEGHSPRPDGLEHRVWVLETWCSTPNGCISGSPQKRELPFPRAWLSFPQCYVLDRLQILCSLFFKNDAGYLPTPCISTQLALVTPMSRRKYWETLWVPWLSISRFRWLSGHLPSLSLLMMSPSWLQSIQLYSTIGSLGTNCLSSPQDVLGKIDVNASQWTPNSTEKLPPDCGVHVEFSSWG